VRWSPINPRTFPPTAPSRLPSAINGLVLTITWEPSGQTGSLLGGFEVIVALVCLHTISIYRMGLGHVTHVGFGIVNHRTRYSNRVTTESSACDLEVSLIVFGKCGTRPHTYGFRCNTQVERCTHGEGEALNFSKWCVYPSNSLTPSATD
jgi:hypothetical protein